MVPQAEISKFVKTYMLLSSIDLYQKSKGIYAKRLVSIQAHAALNIHLGGNKIISKNALTEFLHNLTFQALSKENDDIYLSFDNIGLLVLDILERLEKLNLESINETKIINMKKKQKNPPKLPPLTSTPLLSEKQIKKTYDDANEDYLKTAMTINKTDLDAAVENADTKNEKIIRDVIDPTPGLFVDDQLNLEDQFKYVSNVIERGFNVINNCNRDLIIF